MKTKEVMQILEENKLTNVKKKKKEKDFYDKAQEEKKLLDMSMEESIRQKEERNEKKGNTDSVNKILKGSG